MAGSISRRQAKTKSSAVIASPSDHTASRRLKVQTRPSGEVFQLVARPGMEWPAASTVIRPSSRSPMIAISCTPDERAGSRVSGSAALPRRRVAACGIVEWDGPEGLSAQYPPAPRAVPPITAARRFHVLPDTIKTFYHAPAEVLPGLRQQIQWFQGE